jgi:phosphoribosylaminoimidazole-succinocarboxamide synthase
VTADLFDRCADVCFRLFARGTELAARRGLILADAKYELGLLGDEIVLIDEVHTPDSSRYWYADTYDELFGKNKDQRALDKGAAARVDGRTRVPRRRAGPRHDRRGPYRDRSPLHPPR